MVGKPTLKCPMGGESFHQPEIIIEWEGQPSSDGRGYEYEVFFTDVYNIEEEPDWIQIATVPEDTLKYVWLIPSQVKSSKVRIAVRAKSFRGERSDFSISAANFQIRQKTLLPPAILSPLSGKTYDKYIEIVPDLTSIQGTYSQRSYLHLKYSSAKANIVLRSISDAVPIYTKVIKWNTLNLPPSDDYILYVSTFDSDGNVSDILQIKDIEIRHAGYFILDTTPPVSNISVNGDVTFTNSQDVSVTISAYDEGTGVHSMQLIEGTNVANPEPLSSISTFTLSTGDGTKVIELLLQDFGANRNDGQIVRLFDKVLTGSNFVGLAYLNDGSLWAISDSNALYTINTYPLLVMTLGSEPTSIVSFENQIYIATVDDLNQGTINRYTGAQAVEVILGFQIPDSRITAMTSHDGLMYVGMQNGSIYTFDGSTISFSSQLNNPISSITSDGSTLYVLVSNDDKCYAQIGGAYTEVIV